jgi:hypothetical protein
MVTTSSNTYWAPLKPRITIYSLTDTTYSTPIYSYNAFTDTASSNNKPIGLSFETSTTNVGQCSLTIEDADQDFNENDWLKGNRIFIEGSKDGTTWQPAFKGLSRGIVQEAYGSTGRNLTITGYNYLIRHTERIVKVLEEANIVGGKYDDTDTDQFTHRLLRNILTIDGNYIYTVDEGPSATIPILKTDNVDSSPVDQWIPKVQGDFVQLSSIIDEILDYSGSILSVNFADDQLVLYNPEQVTSATGVFMVTNTVNKLADDVNRTMYPLEPYSYNIYYDTDESSNRLILPYKSPDSEPATPNKEFTPDQINATTNAQYADLWSTANAKQWWAVTFQVQTAGDPGLIRCTLRTFGNCSSFASNSLRCWIYNDTAPPAASKPTIPISGPMVLYPMKSDGTFPTGGVGYPSSPTLHFAVGMKDGDFCGEMLSNQLYWLAFESTAPQTTTNFIAIEAEVKGTTSHATSTNGSTWAAPFVAVPLRIWNVPFKDQGKPEINLDWIAIANDRNGQNRIGNVERTVTSLPNHVENLQTIQEYLYSRIYLSSKPRFSFDYPRLTMPNRIPKAGDVLSHYDTTVNVGTSTTPIQTSIITSARFEFDQGSDGVLGLRKLGLSTAGIRKGYY